MVTTYRITCWGEIYEVAADWARALAADWARASDAVHGCSGNQIDSVTRAEIQTAICDMHEVMGKEVGDAR